MTDFELDRGTDPIPREAREADPAREGRAREIEREIAAEIHAKYDEPLHPRERQWEQRVHYITCPARLAPAQRFEQADPESVTQGFVYWLAGRWFWRPHWGSVDDPSVLELGVDQPPSVELDVESEEEAIHHARRRVAWDLAGGGLTEGG